jgi:hypothetical protein
MRAHWPDKRLLLLTVSLVLAGCDLITGAGEQKIKDAHAIGYACRVSQKVPEICMKENETQSPTSILKGWKDANSDIANKDIDPSMSNKPAEAIAAHSAPAAAESETPSNKVVEKTVTTKSEKQAVSAASKPEKKSEH